MPFELNQIVPWGRSFDEYRRMFNLGEKELAGRILGCGDGPASFNAEAARRGHRVVSCDPLYEYDADAIRRRIDETYETVLEQTRANAGNYLWTAFASVEALGRVRMESMRAFLMDYEEGREAGRYVAASLPELPFGDDEFDLCLSSHFLFLYEDRLDYDFHVAAVREMLRVGREARIFPLLTLDSKPSAFAPRLIADAPGFGWRIEARRVPYEFQRGGNTMMRIRRV
jgi:SAM-dependent methyltransferase